MNQPPLFANFGNEYIDVSAKRHKSNPESVAANKRAAPGKARARKDVLDVLAIAPATSKEIAVILHKPLHAISGRCSELKAMGLAETTGTRRGGAMELRKV